MGYLKWVKPRLKKFTLADFAILKTDVAIIGVIIGAYISGFVKTYIWYFVAAAVILYVLMWRSILKK